MGKDLAAGSASDWQGKHYAFFRNRECEAFPCHAGVVADDFNCLFCYCPLYRFADCGGTFGRTAQGAKDCSGCVFPHQRQNYGAVVERLRQMC